jgi:hypothetical protein
MSAGAAGAGRRAPARILGDVPLTVWECISMKRLLSLVAVLALAMNVSAAEPSKSECLAIGEHVDAFNVRDVTGPNKDKTLCLRCKYGNRPVVAIFTRNVDKKVAELTKQIDKKVVDNKDARMAAFVIVLTEEPDKVEGTLKEVAKANEIKETPLTLFEDATGPKEYKIAKDAETTVMMWVEGKLKVNKAFAKGELKDESIKELVESTKEIL